MRTKLILTSAAALLIGFAAFSQNGNPVNPAFIPIASKDLQYQVRALYQRPVKKENLIGARLISDVVAGYPVNWITSYTSVEIMATCNGKAVKAAGPNATLSNAQKNILNTIDLATYIVVNVKYIYKDPITGDVANNTMHVKMMVIPETEAEYTGGQQQMIKYLKENGIDKISATNLKSFKPVIINFTVNEEGGISNAKIFNTSNDPKTDNILLDAINKMPKWKPAEDWKGKKVKQEFEFSVGNNSGC